MAGKLYHINDRYLICTLFGPLKPYTKRDTGCFIFDSILQTLTGLRNCGPSM